MTDLKYREHYCKQIVSLYLLLYVIGSEKNYKHQISAISKNEGKMFIKEVLGIDHHVNSFILEEKDTNTKYFSHKEMRFMHPVSSEVLYNNVIDLYLNIFGKLIEINLIIEFLKKFYENLLKIYKDNMKKHDKSYLVKFYFSDIIDNQTKKNIFKSFTECVTN
ncbi:hypothetical protein COBT_002993 [Conglomerata obtusa]